MKKLFFLSAILISLSTATLSAKDATVINAEADAAITKFYATVDGGQDFLSKVKGYVIFPVVLKGGFWVGGEYGEGVLRSGGANQGYYSTTTGSLGLQIGLQQKSVLIAFISQRAYDNFLASTGWEGGVGVTANAAIWGATRDLSTLSLESDSITFVFDEVGLMAGVDAQVGKIQKIER
jgi:lipid-binding SYLF domain-containing protein